MSTGEDAVGATGGGEESSSLVPGVDSTPSSKRPAGGSGVQRPASLLPDSWSVRLPVFEGPLDLLLQLVKINEVEVTEIPVALVCDQYHEYLARMEELDLDIAGEYIYEAAMLIQLKSRMLLPAAPVEDGVEPEEDPRAVLVARLLEYQRIKEVAETLSEISSVRRGIWTREWQEPEGEVDDDEELELGDLSLFDLLKTFRRVLDRFDRENPEPLQLSAESFSVREQIDRLLLRLNGGRPIDLVDDLLALSCRGEAIAAFLAFLELARMQLIRFVKSEEASRDAILVERTGREVSALELEGILE